MEKHSISVRIPTYTFKDLSVYAGEKLTSVNNVLVDAIESWWAQQPEKALYAKRRATESNATTTATKPATKKLAAKKPTKAKGK